MKRAAWITWDDNIRNNNIFYNYPDGSPSWFRLMRGALAERGYDLNTIDLYEDLREVDFFLFSANDMVWLDRLIRLDLQDRTIYACGEPAVVMPEHTGEGYREMLHQYAFIMTWNDDLVDGDRIVKRIIPYDFRRQEGKIPFEGRKLLTNISGNKHSDQPMELYSERERVIDYFERSDPDAFDLYGPKWDRARHPCWRGTVADKAETYHHYRFALSLENTYGVKGYITEKIFDCFTAGVVPIYLGASNVAEFIPDDCYIHYDAFASLEELAAYLHSMTRERWQEYLDAIDRFLMSDVPLSFRGEIFGNEIADAADRIGQVHVELSAQTRRQIRQRANAQKWERRRLKMILWVKKILST